MSQSEEIKMSDPAQEQGISQQQLYSLSKQAYRSPETQEIDQLMTVVEWDKDNEMTEMDYENNPYYVNPALVEQ